MLYCQIYIKGVGFCNHPLEDARTPCGLHLFALPTHLKICKRHARWKANPSCNEASLACTAPHQGILIRGIIICLLNIYFPLSSYYSAQQQHNKRISQKTDRLFLLLTS